MNDTRPNIQKLLTFPEESRDKVPTASRAGSESFTVKRDPESPAVFEKLMEEICERRIFVSLGLPILAPRPT